MFFPRLPLYSYRLLKEHVRISAPQNAMLLLREAPTIRSMSHSWSDINALNLRLPNPGMSEEARKGRWWKKCEKHPWAGEWNKSTSRVRVSGSKYLSAVCIVRKYQSAEESLMTQWKSREEHDLEARFLGRRTRDIAYGFGCIVVML